MDTLFGPNAWDKRADHLTATELEQERLRQDQQMREMYRMLHEQNNLMGTSSSRAVKKMESELKRVRAAFSAYIHSTDPEMGPWCGSECDKCRTLIDALKYMQPEK